MKREDIRVGQKLVLSYQTPWEYLTVDYIGNEKVFGTITYNSYVPTGSEYAIGFGECSPYKEDKRAKIREILDS